MNETSDPSGATVDADGEPVALGDVVQVDPESDPVFGGCLLIVDTLVGFAVVGFVHAPAPAGPVPYYYRVESKDFKRIGRAAFRVPEV